MGGAREGTKKGKALFRNAGFLRYIVMSASSRTASSVFVIAVVWVVFESTRSVIDVGIVALAESVTTIAFTLPGGVWVDRYSRSRLLVLSNLVRAASLGLLAAVIAVYGFQLTVVVAVAVAWSGATELYRSSNYSYLPELVGPGELSDANGVTRASTAVVASASSAMGGGIIAFAGAVVAFAYGAIGFAAAAALALLLYARSVPTQARSLIRAGMLSEVRAGMGWLVSQRGLLYLSISATVFNFLGGAVYYYLVVYMVQGIGLGAFALGVAVGANVFGAALGSLALGRTGGLSRAGVAWVLGVGSVPGALYLLMGLEPLLAVAIAALFGIGFAQGFGGNAWLTAAQNIVPEGMRGRYFAIDGFFSFIGGPPAIAAGSLLIALVGVLPAYTYIGAALLFASLGFAALRDLWKLDGRPSGA